MKKIYASMLVLAMGTCITAGARTYQRANINFDNISVRSFETVDNLVMSDKTISKKVAKVKANAGEEWNVLGEGILVDGIFTGEQFTVTIEESASTPGYYRVPDAFTALDENAAPFEVDATDPTNVVVPAIETGMMLSITLDGVPYEGELTLLSFSEYYLMNGVSLDEFKASLPQYVITFEDGIVNFPEGSLIGSVGDSEPFFLNDDEMALVFPGAEFVPTWGEIKTGQMYDTFFEAIFTGYEPQECDVLIQKNNKVEGSYRIIDPWYRLFGETAPDPEAGYYFYIDASHPECVVVPYQSSGVSSQQRGAVYVLSESANYLDAGYTIEDFLASEDASSNFTMDTDTRTINFTGSEITLSDETTAFCGPLYIVYPQSANPNSMYVVSPYNTPGWIKIPDFNTDGISSVAVDNNNAKAEYYNIQGIRVDNPVAGQLYIVKKGNEVSKQIIR